MYYPLLRGRQFELLAIREVFSDEWQTYENIVPVIEPVKTNFNSLDLANNALKDSQEKMYLIVNPSVGELSGLDYEIVLDYINSDNNFIFLPAFIFSDNSSKIIELIDKYKINNCMLLLIDNSINEIDELLENKSITHIILSNPNQNRRIRKRLSDLKKSIIRLDDLFEKKERNSDYLNIVRHKFSEENVFYKDDKYTGFSDYTTLPMQFQEGGSIPKAVVIHLTYIDKDTGEIWINHITSDSNDSISNIQGKFAEAAKKAIDFCNEIKLTNPAILELIDYYTNNKYPGLGVIKKLSIKNHLYIINEYLTKTK